MEVVYNKFKGVFSSLLVVGHYFENKETNSCLMLISNNLYDPDRIPFSPLLFPFRMPFEARSFYKTSLTRRGVERQNVEQHIFTPDPEESEDDDFDDGEEEGVEIEDPLAEIDDEFLGASNDLSSDSENESEIEGAKSAAKATRSKEKGKPNVRWRHMNPVVVDASFRGGAFPTPPDEIPSPVEYFHNFFERNLMSHIAEQTNLYSVQSNGRSIQTDENEIEQLIGMMIMMGVISYPQYRMHWSPETRIPVIADTISLTRFENLKRFLHFNDNNQMPLHKDDKLHKVRPVLNSVLEKCRSLPPEESHSVDEQMIPTKSRSALRQYLPKSPINGASKCGLGVG